MKAWRFVPLVLACALFGALPAQAGLFDDDIARAGVAKLQTELGELILRVDGLGKNQVDFANQVESINAELAKIRGQLEVLGYELEAAQKRQKDFYVNLDNRLRKLETSAIANAGDEAGAVKADDKPADPAAETRDYEAALKALKASKFRDALSGYLGFIKNYPNSGLLASAHFWAGYCYSQLNEPMKAAELYGRLAAAWPEDSKAPDALLAQAENLEAAGQKAAAQKVLSALVGKYPSSEAGKAAKQKLKKK